MTNFSPRHWLAAIVVLLLPHAATAAPTCADSQAPLNTDVSITLDPSTTWQPRGGQVRFIVESKSQTLKGMELAACFAWTGRDALKNPLPVGVDVVSFTPNKGVYVVTVPDLPDVAQPWPQRLFGPTTPASASLPSLFEAAKAVPMASLRIIAHGGDVKAAADVSLRVGVTSVWGAGIGTILAVVIAIAILDLWAKLRTVPGHGLLLRLITTRSGYASLSQFQIMLWSFVFGAGAVYVMGLSGSLINIPTGALVLLGIAGAATVGSKIQNANASAPAAPSAAGQPPPAAARPDAVTGLRTLALSPYGVGLAWTAPAAGAAVASYRVDYAPANTGAWTTTSAAIAGTSSYVRGLEPSTAYDFQVFAVNAAGPGPGATLPNIATPEPTTPPRRPSWSDLVMTSTRPGEIDVTRVQMLFFTLISASFVAMKLFNGYQIPDIPEGFMLLMGISNGVYLSAKFVPD